MSIVRRAIEWEIDNSMNLFLLSVNIEILLEIHK